MTRSQYPAWARRRRRGAPDTAAMESLARALVSTDEAAIRAVLHAEVVLTVDSDGLMPSAATPSEGCDAAASGLLELMTPDTSIEQASINSVPGLTLSRDQTVVAAISAEMRSGMLSSIWVVCNPEKLRHWNRR